MIKKTVVSELTHHPDLDMYEDIEEGAPRLVKFEGVGRSVKNAGVLIEDVKRSGRTIFFTQTDEGADELLPAEVPLSGLDRIVLDLMHARREEYGWPKNAARLYGNLHRVFKETGERGKLTAFRNAVHGLSPDEAAGLARDVCGFEKSTYMRKLEPAKPEVVDFLWKLDGIILRRLGRELKTPKISSAEVKGIIVAYGPEMINGWYQMPLITKRDGSTTVLKKTGLDLDLEFLGKRWPVILLKMRSVAGRLSEGIGRSIKMPSETTVGRREAGLCREHAAELVKYYASKWRNVNDTWRGSKTNLEFLKAFDDVKYQLVMQPWQELGWMRNVSENTAPQLSDTISMLNLGLRRGTVTQELVREIGPKLESLGELFTADRGEANQAVREKATRMSKALRILCERPDVFVDLARAWRARA